MAAGEAVMADTSLCPCSSPLSSPLPWRARRARQHICTRRAGVPPAGVRSGQRREATMSTIPQNVQDAINEQIRNELFSAYLYL